MECGRRGAGDACVDGNARGFPKPSAGPWALTRGMRHASLAWLIFMLLSTTSCWHAGQAAGVGVSPNQYVCEFKNSGCGLISDVTSRDLNVSYEADHLRIRFGSGGAHEFLKFLTGAHRLGSVTCVYQLWVHPQSPSTLQLNYARYWHPAGQPRGVRIFFRAAPRNSLAGQVVQAAFSFDRPEEISYWLEPRQQSQQQSLVTPTIWLTSIRLTSCEVAPPANASCVSPNMEPVLSAGRLGYDCQCAWGHSLVGGKCVSCGCANGNGCARLSGKCQCSAEFAGRKCQVCAPSYSGQNCSVNCDCRNGGVCAPGSSVCQCLPGFSGQRCELNCGSGGWGAGCRGVCNCQNGGRCDATRGCVCVQGFSGANCSHRIVCPALAIGSTLQLVSTEGNGYLNRTRTKCQTGLAWVSGQHVRMCSADGTWSGSTAVCRAQLQEQTGCGNESVQTSRGLFVWPETRASATRHISCPVAVDDGPLGTASRRCRLAATGQAVWDVANISVCAFSSARTQELRRLHGSQEALLGRATTAVSVARASESVSRVCESDHQDLSEDDVVLAAELLSGIAAAASAVFSSNATQDQGTVNQMLNKFLAASGHIASSVARSDGLGKSSSKARDSAVSLVTKSLEKLVQTIPLIDPGQSATAVSASLGLVSVCPDAASGYRLSVDTLTAAADVSVTSFSGGDSDGIRRAPAGILSLSLPAEALALASAVQPTSSPYQCRHAKANFVAYNSPGLFRSSSSTSARAVSSVVSAKAGSMDGTRLSSSTVEATFSIKNTSHPVALLTCGFWDFGSREWREDGCKLLSLVRTRTGLVGTCRCNHLTNFALLVRPPMGSGASALGHHSRALKLLSLIACGISALCLALTCVVFLASAALYKNLRHHITLCIAVALLLSMILFTVGGPASASTVGCRTVAILLHYFLLTSFCWMTTQAVLMYRELVVVFDSIGHRFFRIACLFCFGLPAGVVLATAAASGLSVYGCRADGLCFLVTNASFYGAFFAPMMLLVALNTVVVFRVTAVARHVRHGIAAHKGLDAGGKDATVYLARVSFSLSILVGATWLLGGLVAFVDGVAIQYFFTVLNSLQGAAIFYCHVIASKEVRAAWSDTIAALRAPSSAPTPDRPGKRADSKVPLPRSPAANGRSSRMGLHPNRSRSPSPGKLSISLGRGRAGESRSSSLKSESINSAVTNFTLAPQRSRLQSLERFRQDALEQHCSTCTEIALQELDVLGDLPDNADVFCDPGATWDDLPACSFRSPLAGSISDGNDEGVEGVTTAGAASWPRE